MSRWTGDPDIANVLAAADAWRQRCVEADGSVLSNEPLWTQANLADVKQRFVGNPIVGTDLDFYEKLQKQLAGAPSRIMKLAAEVVWFLLLFPHHSKFGVDTKLAQIRMVWEWSGSKLPASPNLQDAALKGVGHPGTAYLTRRFEQFGFVLEVFERFKSLDPANRKSLLEVDVPWSFTSWMDAIPDADRRPVRNAILYFLFPDDLERNLSNDHRRQIVAQLGDRLPKQLLPKGPNAPLIEFDKAINALRKHFENELGTTSLDFYRAPIHQMWWTGVREAARSQIASELKTLLSKFGVELNQCGNKKKKLSDCPAVSTQTGFWEDPNSATSKPLRWFIHLEVADGQVTASIPNLQGARRVAFANTSQGTSGAVTIRIIPVIKLSDKKYMFHEVWEWLLLFCFMPALPVGSSGQLFDDFDVATGVLKYMGKPQKYVTAALIALNEETDVLSSPEIAQSITYAQATAAISSLIHFNVSAEGE